MLTPNVNQMNICCLIQGANFLWKGITFFVKRPCYHQFDVILIST